MELTIRLKVKIDEESIAEKYPQFGEQFEDVEDFKEMLLNSMESPIERDGQAINWLELYGYEVMIMDRSDKPEEE
jgi:hypothetical protein